jgi:hypothetical protein
MLKIAAYVKGCGRLTLQSEGLEVSMLKTAVFLVMVMLILVYS